MDLTSIATLDSLPIDRLVLNVLAILVSLVGVVYWNKLYRRIHPEDKHTRRAWLWIFSAILAILLLNVASIFPILSESQVFLGGTLKKVKVDLSTLELLDVFGRTVIGLALMVGAYLLYSPMRKETHTQYRFVPVTPVKEAVKADDRLHYDLKAGRTYIVREDHSIEKGSEDYFLKGSLPEKSLRIFRDLVVHGVHGLCITRIHPPRMRDMLKLEKTPILWLTREKDYTESINPVDLVELGHTIKEFVKKSRDSVVLLDGIEYLVTQNSYQDVLKFIQSLNDSISLSNSRLIIPIDPSTLEDKQMHLLERELSEITSVWNT